MLEEAANAQGKESAIPIIVAIMANTKVTAIGCNKLGIALQSGGKNMSRTANPLRIPRRKVPTRT